MPIQKRTLTVRFGRSENANTPNTVEVTVMALATVSDTVSNVTFIGGPQTQVVLLANDTNTVTFSLVPSDAAGMTEPIKYRIAWRERFIGRQYTYDFYMPDANSEFADLEMLPPSGAPTTGGTSPTVPPTPDFIYASEIADATTVGQALIKAVDALAARTAIGATATGNILITAANAAAAITALTGTQTAGRYLRSDGTNSALSAIVAADVPTLNQNTTGNAATATKLATARTINGVSFDGTANITVADSTKQATSEKGVANGYASLDPGGKVPVAQLPSSIMEYQGVWNASTNSPTLANGTGSPGDVYRVSVAGTALSLTFEVGDYIIYNGSAWEKSDTTDAVASVAGKTGNVTLTSTDVGLGNVDNTSDATKNAAAVALTNKTAVTSTGAVTGSQLVSTVATGTAPLTVASTTQVTNLNADTVRGYIPAQAASALTVAARDASANVAANTFSSTVATGTAPFTVASTTQVNNLNADLLRGYVTSSGAGFGTIALRDNNANLSARGFLANFSTVATAAGTTTLTVTSNSIQEFTGTLAQTVLLPTTSVVAGAQYTIINNSTGLVTVQSSAAATIVTLAANTQATFTALVATPTTAANWGFDYSGHVQGFAVATSATGSTVALRDGNGFLFAKNFNAGFLTTATAAGTTTLLVNSQPIQEWTGTLSQTVVLPTTGVVAGQKFTVINNSTGVVTVQSSSTATVVALAAGATTELTALVATPTTAAHWKAGNGNASTINGLIETTAATVSTVAVRDSNANLSARNFINTMESTVAAGGTSTLTVANGAVQYFSGNGSHTLLLPTTGVTAGMRYTVINQQSTGSVFLQSSTGATISTIAAGYSADFTALINTPTTAAHWRCTTWPNSSAPLVTTGNSLSALSASTTNAIGVGTIELGHATDTTLSRSAAGTLAVDGVDVVTTSAVQAITNKTLTAPTITQPLIGSGLKDTGGAFFLTNNITASAVNNFRIAAAVGGSPPTLAAEGTDADVSAWIQPKGAGFLIVGPGTTTQSKITASGTNTDLVLSSKGTGTVQANGVPVVTTTSTQSLTNKTLINPTIDGTPTGTGVDTAATVSTLALRDSVGNLYADNFISSVQSTVTAAGTTTLLQASAQVQVFTGTNTHTVLLPTNSVFAGQKYSIINNSTGAVAVQSSTGDLIVSITAGYNGEFTALVNTPTTAANWRGVLISISGMVATSSNSLGAFARSDTNTIGVGNIELGHASDTTLSRSAAGTLAVEGVDVVTTTGAQAISGKTSIASTGAVTGSTLVSNVATGTAPLTVASTTLVANLNAASVNGYTFSSGATNGNTLVPRDANGIAVARNFIPTFTTTATAGGSTAMTISSSATQEFTGTTTQTVSLPTSQIIAGTTYLIINNSTGAVTVNASGGGTVATLAASTSGRFVSLVATPTTAAGWART